MKSNNIPDIEPFVGYTWKMLLKLTGVGEGWYSIKWISNAHFEIILNFVSKCSTF